MTTLYIPAKEYQKLNVYVNSDPSLEIGGMFSVIPFEDSLWVKKVYLIEQEVSSGECELSAEGVAKLYEELIERGEVEEVDNLKGWWHSHGRGNTFWSKTDDDTMFDKTWDWVACLVVNCKMDSKARLVVNNPIQLHCDLEAKQFVENQVDKKSLLEEVKAKVTKVKTSIVLYGNNRKYVRSFENCAYKEGCGKQPCKNQKSNQCPIPSWFPKAVSRVLTSTSYGGYGGMYEYDLENLEEEVSNNKSKSLHDMIDAEIKEEQLKSWGK